MKSSTPKPTESEKTEKLINKKSWVTPELDTLDINKTESGVTYGAEEGDTFLPQEMSF